MRFAGAAYAYSSKNIPARFEFYRNTTTGYYFPYQIKNHFNGGLNSSGAKEFALHKFPDGNFARACPRGFCLSHFTAVAACAQTKTTLWASNPNVTPSSWCYCPYQIKNHLNGGLNSSGARIRT